MSEPLPLQGVRVIELARVLAGPYCGALLADMGADVIKVEQVGDGDEARTWPPTIQGQSACHLGVNRNKRSVAVDLKTAGGKQILSSLTASADVVIENYRLGGLERLGFGPERLRELNPSLILCRISGFGRTGPLSDLGAYEALMQAFGGTMSLTGEPKGVPARAGVSFLDLSTGILAAFAVTVALLQRRDTGKGQIIDASLFDTSTALLMYHAQAFLLNGSVASRMGSGHVSLVPYRAFMAADEQYVFIAAGNDRLWRALCEALSLEALGDDERYRTNADRVRNRDLVEDALATRLLQLRSEEVVSLLQAVGVPASPINSVDQVMTHPQMVGRGLVQRVDHPLLNQVDVVGFPALWGETRPPVRRAAPLLGEHTRQVLDEEGFSETQIESWQQDGTIAFLR